MIQLNVLFSFKTITLVLLAHNVLFSWLVIRFFFNTNYWGTIQTLCFLCGFFYFTYRYICSTTPVLFWALVLFKICFNISSIRYLVLVSQKQFYCQRSSTNSFFIITLSQAFVIRPFVRRFQEGPASTLTLSEKPSFMVDLLTPFRAGDVRAEQRA